MLQRKNELSRMKHLSVERGRCRQEEKCNSHVSLSLPPFATENFPLLAALIYMSTAPAIDLSQFDDDYRRHQSAGIGPKPQALPDGRYQVLIEHLEVTESKASGNPMMKWTFRVTGPTHFANRILWKNTVITQKTLGIIKDDLKTCGLELEQLNDLHRRAAELFDVPLEITKRTNGEYENVYLNRRLDHALPEDDTPF